MRIVFKNLEKSSVARDAVEERLGEVIDKFPRLEDHVITVTLSMENSPLKPGPDSFGVKVLIRGPVFKTVTLQKRSPSLYKALAEVKDHLLEILNRTGDKMRVQERSKNRRFSEAV